MIGQLGHIMVSVADSIMVGQLGTLALAAVALASSVYVVFLVFGIGVAYGITPLVGKSAGKGFIHVQGVLLRHAFWINLLVGIGLFLLMLLMLPVMDYMGQNPAIVPPARSYFVIVASSVVPLMIYLSFKQFAEGLEDTRIAMIISIACNLINIGLNYLLIYGAWGFPEMGIVGAAWATLIARILMMVWIWLYVRRAKKFKIYALRIRFVRFRRKIAYRLLQIGLPSGLQYIFEVGAFSLAAVFAGMISATALAAHQIAINIASVSYMAVTGIGAAATVRVSNQRGKGGKQNLEMTSKSIFTMAFIWMVFCGLIILGFRNVLPEFYSDDPTVIALAKVMLLIVVLFQISDGIQAVALGALRGFTDVRIPTLITFCAYWLITLPLAYGLSQHTTLGAMGIWYALAGGLTLSAVLLLRRYYRLQRAFL